MTKRPPPPDLGSFRPLGDQEPDRPTRQTARPRPSTEPPSGQPRTGAPTRDVDPRFAGSDHQSGEHQSSGRQVTGRDDDGTDPYMPRIARGPVPPSPPSSIAPTGLAPIAADRPVTVRFDKPPRRPAPPPQDFNYDSHDVEPEASGWGRRIGLAVVGVVLLVLAGGATLLAFPPTSIVRDRLIQEVKARTGRDLTITGATKLSMLPNLAVSMAGVTISPPPGMAGGPTLTMASLDAEVQLWPLILRDIVIDRLVLRQPVIDLRIDAGGRKSWDFAGGSDPLVPTPLVRFAQLGPKDVKSLPKDVQDFVKGAGDTVAKGGARTAANRLDNLTLSDVRIENGSLRYTDERTGVAETVTGLDVTLTAKNLGAPLDAIGRLTWSGDALDFNARATPFRAVLEDKPAQIVAVVKAPKADLAYDGIVLLGPEPEFDGKVTARLPSVAEAARWVGATGVPALPGALEFAGHARHANMLTTLSDATAKLGTLAVAGTVTVDTKTARPFVKGSLRFADLDFNAITALIDGAANAPAIVPRAKVAPMIATPGTSPAAAPNPQSIEDLLRDGAAPKPQVRGLRSVRAGATPRLT
jgi:AsmA protein